MSMLDVTIIPVPALRTVRVTRYVTPLREGGSLPAIVEADDDGMYTTDIIAGIVETDSGCVARRR